MLDRESADYAAVMAMFGIPQATAVAVPVQVSRELLARPSTRAQTRLRAFIAQGVAHSLSIGDPRRRAASLSRAFCCRRVPDEDKRAEYRDTSREESRAFFAVSASRLHLSDISVAHGTVAVVRLRGGECVQTIRHFHYVVQTDHECRVCDFAFPPGVSVHLSAIRTSTHRAIAYIEAQLSTPDGSVNTQAEAMQDEARNGHEEDEFFGENSTEASAEDITRQTRWPIGTFETHVTRQDLGMRTLPVSFSADFRPRSVFHLRSLDVDGEAESYHGEFYVRVSGDIVDTRHRAVRDRVRGLLEGCRAFDRARCVLFA